MLNTFKRYVDKNTDVQLTCDNPLCEDREIPHGSNVAYFPSDGRIYHAKTMKCINQGPAANMLSSEEITFFGNYQIISFGEAARLLREGKLKQSK